MPREIDSAVFPHLDADLERVRDVLGPVQLRGRPELTALTDEGPDTSRRQVQAQTGRGEKTGRLRNSSTVGYTRNASVGHRR